MPLYGDLKQADTYTISIDNGPTGAGRTAVTVLKINRRDQIASAETEVVQPGARLTLTGKPGSQIDRLVIQVHPPVGGTVNVDVRTPNAAFIDTVVGDTDFVFETVP